MSDITILRVTSAAEMALALEVRRQVFVEEQGIDEALEIDEHDGNPTEVTSCVHVAGLVDGLPVAAGRLLLGAGPHEEAHIGRVAVLASARGHGMGKAVMAALQDIARSMGYSSVAISAQEHALGFYEKLGYVCDGEPYIEAGIPHRAMRLEL